MNPHFAPPQREVRSSIFTTAGWLTGTVVVPAMRNFVDFVNQPDHYFKLRNAKLPGISRSASFFALQRESVILIVPDQSEETLRMTTLTGDRVEREVSCVFDSGIVSGFLFVPPEARVSDFLMQKRSFFHLRDCTIYLRSQESPDLRKDVVMVVVNGRRIIGVSEPRII